MNYSLHTDLYQLNMAYSYFNDNVQQPYCQAVIEPKIKKFIANHKTHLK